MTDIAQLPATSEPARPSARGRELRRAAGTGLITFGLALLVIWLGRVGADWPAQDFRAYVAQHGLSVWTNSWYAGSALPGYSVLYPLLAALLGSSGVGVFAATAAGALGAALAPARGVRYDVAFCAAVVLGVLECLVIGQTTFLLGVAGGAGALVALRHDRPAATAVLAALCSLASPLAGLFLVIGALGFVRTLGWRRAALLAPGLAGAAVAAVVDSGGGPFTYHLVTLGAIGAFCGSTLLLTDRPHRADRADRALRDFAYAYLVLATVAYLVANPVGSNLNRLGRLVAAPLAVYYLASRSVPRWRRVAVALAAVLATWWSLIPLVTAVRWGADDPGRHLAYYRGLLDYLDRHDATAGRIEIPFTRTHTEAYWVARAHPLARGWERQVDLGENEVLYAPLTPGAYRAWLDEHAVSTLEPDIGGWPEVNLLRDPPAYLRPVWHDEHWHVWRVVNPAPLASAPARVTALGPASVRLRFAAPGTSVLRVRASPLWTVADGAARLERSAAGWLQVTAERAGEVLLRARLNLALLDPWNPLR